MGGTGSVPGSYCMATVYGDDIDVASWDFGMTEGNNYDHTEMFFRYVGSEGSNGQQRTANSRRSNRKILPKRTKISTKISTTFTLLSRYPTMIKSSYQRWHSLSILLLFWLNTHMLII